MLIHQINLFSFPLFCIAYQILFLPKRLGLIQMLQIGTDKARNKLKFLILQDQGPSSSPQADGDSKSVSPAKVTGWRFLHLRFFNTYTRLGYSATHLFMCEKLQHIHLLFHSKILLQYMGQSILQYLDLYQKYCQLLYTCLAVDILNAKANEQSSD